VQGGRDPEERKMEEERIGRSLDRIKHKILVLSGKGGVGKSTVAAYLALSLAKSGRKVGLMDVDLHGPTIPVLLGIRDQRPKSDGESMLPVPAGSNLQVLSIGNLMEHGDQAVIWRGPLKIGAIRQFIGDVNWGPLDFLIIDSPPGTGDEPLTVAQTVPGVQAVIVTTPQEVSLADVRRSINFCKKVEMPILGLIENLAGYECPKCGDRVDLFGSGGGQKTALENGVSFLGSIPIDPAIVRGGDRGKPFIDEDGETPAKKAFMVVVGAIEEKMGQKSTKTEKPEEPMETVQAARQVIALPTNDGLVCEHFGHCSQMMFFTVEDGKIVDEKSLAPPDHAPGVLPKWLSEQGANVILAGGMGSRAVEMFEGFGVHVITGVSGGGAREVVTAYVAGELSVGDNVCDH